MLIDQDLIMNTSLVTLVWAGIVFLVLLVVAYLSK